MLQDTLVNNAFGFVVVIGELLNFITDPIDGVTPSVGDKIFLKSGGGLTTVKPTTSSRISWKGVGWKFRICYSIKHNEI